MGEHAVGPMEGRVEDGVAVLPLVPRNIPEPLNERSNPALRRVVVMGQQSPAIECLGGLPMMGDEASGTILPSKVFLGRERRTQGGVSTMANRDDTGMP